jgi:hypothetical protein
MYLSIKRRIRSQVRRLLSLRRLRIFAHSQQTFSLKADMAGLFMGTP